MRPAKYDVDRLIESVAQASTMTELLHLLEEQITPGKRAAMWARLGHYGIDTSHWERSPRLTYSVEDLAVAVRQSESIAGVLRRLGIKPAGGSHFHISRRIRALGLDTSHFLGQAHNRGRIGPRKTAQEILVRLPLGSARADGRMLSRALLEIGVTHACAVCSLGPVWLGNPLTLTVDHVDGDWLNNNSDNLRFLCPNCHAQTSTWCRRKGS
jgi:hypothetical protein